MRKLSHEREGSLELCYKEAFVLSIIFSTFAKIANHEALLSSLLFCFSKQTCSRYSQDCKCYAFCHIEGATTKVLNIMAGLKVDERLGGKVYLTNI